VSVEDETKVRRVHRTMLKAVVGVDSPGRASPHNLSPREEPPPEDEPPFEYDLLVFDQHDGATSAMPSARATMSQVPTLVSASGALTSPARPFVTCPDSRDMGSRQTRRPTAGQHSNVHHLPRSAANVQTAHPFAPVSNSVSALFRPWSSLVVFC